MEASVLTRDLSKVVSIASRFISNRSQLPILGNIVLKTDKTRLYVSATNLETSVSAHIGAQIKEEGEIALPGKVFSEIVSNVSGEHLDLLVKKESAQIKTEGFSSSLAAMNTSDFPSIPNKIPADAVLLPKEFLDNLSKILFSVSSDEARPVLTGVFFIASQDQLTLVSSDGFRLSKISLNLKSELEDSFIIPKNILIELTKIAEADSSISFVKKKEEALVVFGLDDLTLASRVIDGAYPNFGRIIPKSTKTTLSVSKTDLERALKLSSVFARESGNIVAFEVLEGGLKISAESQKTGNQESLLDAKIEGPSVSISFNFRFIEEFLKVCTSDTVTIKLTDSSSPCIWEDPKAPTFLHLIMPVKN